jgi:hypothetical protein
MWKCAENTWGEHGEDMQNMGREHKEEWKQQIGGADGKEEHTGDASAAPSVY